MAGWMPTSSSRLCDVEEHGHRTPRKESERIPCGSSLRIGRVQPNADRDSLNSGCQHVSGGNRGQRTREDGRGRIILDRAHRSAPVGRKALKRRLEGIIHNPNVVVGGFLEGKVLTAIVIHTVNAGRTLINSKIEAASRVGRRAAHPGAQGPWSKFERAVVFGLCGPPGEKAGRLGEVNAAVVVARSWSSAIWTAACGGRLFNEGLAAAAYADGRWIAERIRLCIHPVAARTVVDDADGGEQLIILDGLCAWRELADRDVQLAVDDTLLWRPASVGARRTAVIEVADLRRKSEHWQHAVRCKAFAQGDVGQALGMTIDLGKQVDGHMPNHLRNISGSAEMCSPENGAAYLLNGSRICIQPCCYVRPALDPVCHRPKFTVHIVAADWQLQTGERSAEDFLVDDALGDFGAPDVHIRARRWLSGIKARTFEVVVIVASAAAKRECHG